MLIIELQFLSGRFHATPWGRNVNEGDIEWPPSPFRFARALIDVWKRRYPDWSDERMSSILELFSFTPLFYLPPATASHTRAFLNSNDKNPFKQQLIFDAFVAVNKGSKVLIGFPGELDGQGKTDLSTLLSELNYLGRSESWVRSAVVEGDTLPAWNCCPVGSGADTREGSVVRVACMKSQDTFQPESQSKDWLDAVCMTTKVFLNQGWSDPPALEWVDYRRKSDALSVVRSGQGKGMRSRFHFVKYALSGKVLPRIQDTCTFAERARTYLMGIHRKIEGGDPSMVSSKFSGKDRDGKPLKGHRHVFYWPVDEDKDGIIDHLLLKSFEPFDLSELSAIDRLVSIHQPGGRPKIDMVLVALSTEIDQQLSTKWASVTPFVTSRHYRKGRGSYNEWIQGEIRRECHYHGLPEPLNIEMISHTANRPHSVRWLEFVRNRKNKRPTHGNGFMLTFAEPVNGPFALGSNCHFGLGFFEKITSRT